MKKKTLLKIIAPSILAIAVSGGIIAGSTYALFTSNSETNVAITAGKVNASVELGDVQLYSADSTLTTGDIVPGGDQLGVHAGEYRYKDVTADGRFLNGGTATMNGSTLNIKEMSPGDKIVTSFKVTNNSNIDIKYRLVAETTSAQNADLKFFSKLNFTALGFTKTNVKKYYTQWAYWDAPANAADKVKTSDVSIAMPLALSNEFQSGTTNIKLSAEFVQGNAITNNDEDELLVFEEEKITANDLEASGMNNMTLKAGGTDAQPQVKVEVPTGTVGEVKANGENVEIGDTLKLSVVEDVQNPVIAVQAGQQVSNYDVSLVNQDGEAITSTTSKLKVSIYVGEGKDIVGVYHKNVAVPSNEYTYENGYIVFLTSSFSPFTVVFQEYYKGTGTQADPYIIDSVKNLKAVSTKLGATSTTYFKVDADIEVKNTDVGNYLDSWGKPIVSVVDRVDDMVIDFNGHKITSELDHCIFNDVRNSTLKNLDVELKGTNTSLIYYSENIELNDVDVSGDTTFTSGNNGAFIVYPRHDATLIGCNNAVNISTTSGDTTFYNGAFFGYTFPSNNTYTFTDCEYSGVMKSGKAGMFAGNCAYGSPAGEKHSDFIINNTKNNGQIITLSSNNKDYNYFVGILSEKAYAFEFVVDGTRYTSISAIKYTSLEAGQTIVGTGSFSYAAVDEDLKLEVNADNTFKITQSKNANVASYNVTVGVYCGTQTGSQRMYVSETVAADSQATTVNTTLKKLQFVDDVFAANNEAVAGTLAGNKTWTVGSDVYYALTESTWFFNNNTARDAEMISVSALDANGGIIAVYTLLDAAK